MRAPNYVTGKVLMTLVVLACLPVAASASSFTNGTFDTGIAGWTLDAGPDCHQVSHSTLGNPGGSALLNRCGSGLSDASLTQFVSGLTIGTQYLLAWENRLHVSIAPNGKSFGVFIDGAVAKLSENLTTTWVADSYLFVATNTSHSFTFAAELDARTASVPSTSDVSYFLDNVSLTARQTTVPEPSTLLLLSVGLGLGLLRRRRPSR